MAKVKISEFSANPANNTDIDGINIAENCPPSGINDAIRELMAQLKDFQAGTAGDSFNGPVGTTTAAAGAFTTLSASGAVTLSAATANGVVYANGSKVLTSGSALTFDGTNLGVGTASPVFSNSGTGLMVNGTTAGTVRVTQGGGTQAGEFRADANNITIGSRTNGSLIFEQFGSEAMRLTSTGLGIGTSSPAAKLDVISSSTYQLRVASATGNYADAGIYLGSLGTGDPYYYGTVRYVQSTETTNISNNSSSSGKGGISFLIGRGNPGTQSQVALIDSSGNLGLGVTPSAWGSSGNAQFQKLTFAGNDYSLGSNYYQPDAYRYVSTEPAARLSFYNGQFLFYTAPSGTAGNAISFTQAMTLTAAGDLQVGFTGSSITAGGIASVPNSANSYRAVGHITGSASGSAYDYFLYAGSIIGSITQNGTTAVSYNTSSDYRLKNITGPITTSGAYIDSLNPVEGTWKTDGSTFVGLIAHEVQEASRTPVATGVKDGEQMQCMDYSSAEIIANLIAEVKSLRQRLAAAGI